MEETAPPHVRERAHTVGGEGIPLSNLSSSSIVFHPNPIPIPIPTSPSSSSMAGDPSVSSSTSTTVAPSSSSPSSSPSPLAVSSSASGTTAAGPSGLGVALAAAQPPNPDQTQPQRKNHRLHRAEREADFIRMLVRGDFAVLHALYESVDTGSEATVLVDASVHYFYTKGPNAQLLLELLKSLIDKEVDSTASPATLFRSNSAAAKMLSATLQHVGTKYLQMTLRKIVHEVCMNNPRLEIDPLKIKPEENYDENLKRLVSYCELFFNTITKSLEDCPVFMRHICEYVQMSAVRKFPESKQIRHNLSAVGGLLFLRFFCPAIFTPHKFSVVEAAPGPIALRALILISKVMQMMANGLRFSDKAEQYMMPMNDFIDKHAAELLTFFTEASTVPSEEEAARLEQKQRQAFQERVLKDISNPHLVKNERLQQMMEWKSQNAALLSPRQARLKTGTSETRSERQLASSAASGPTTTPSPLPHGSVARSAPELQRDLRVDDQIQAHPGEGGANASHHGVSPDEEGQTKPVSIPSSHASERKDDSSDMSQSAPSGPASALGQTSPTAGPHGSGEGHVLPRRDEREQRAEWLDVIHFYLHRNLDKIRTLMQTPELLEDFKHLEKVLAVWTVPEIETEEQKREKERKERERKEKQKEKEQHEKRERELIELPSKDSHKEKDKETALEKATRRLLLKKTKIKGDQESASDSCAEDGEDLERVVNRLRIEKEKEEELRKHAEKERENLKKAKEMIEKELIALVEDSKKMRVEIFNLQKDRELVDHWRSEAEKEKAKTVALLEEKHQLLVKISDYSEEKKSLDSARAMLEAEREQMKRERRNAEDRVKELEAALKAVSEELAEVKETYKAYEERMKEEERRRAKKVRERLEAEESTDDSSKKKKGEEKERRKEKDKEKEKEKAKKEQENKERRKKRHTLTLRASDSDETTGSKENQQSEDQEKNDKEQSKKEKKEKKKAEETVDSSQKELKLHGHPEESDKEKRRSKRASLRKGREGEKDEIKTHSPHTSSTSVTLPVVQRAGKMHDSSEAQPLEKRSLPKKTLESITREDEGWEIKKKQDNGELTADVPARPKTGSHVAVRKASLRRTEGEIFKAPEIRRSRSFDAAAYKEATQSVMKRPGKTDLDLKAVGKQMRNEVESKTHKHNLKRFENCFRGAQAVDWLLQSGHAESRAEAVEVGRQLLSAGDVFGTLPGLETDFVDDDRSVYQFLLEPHNP